MSFLYSGRHTVFGFALNTHIACWTSSGGKKTGANVAGDLSVGEVLRTYM